MKAAPWLRRLRALTVKELLQLMRDPALMLFTLYAFTLDIYFAGSGMTLQLNNASIMFRDLDRSSVSREFIHRFRPPYFIIKGEVSGPKEGMRLLDQGEIMALVEIPPHLEQDLASGRGGEIQMMLDTSSSGIGLLAAGYAARIAAETGAALIRQGGPGGAPLVQGEYRVWYNQNQEDSWFMSTAELFTVVTLFAILLPATAMVREKQRGTVEQLLVSPLSPLQIITPKVVAMTLVCVAGSLLALVSVLWHTFHVPFKGSMAMFLAITTLHVVTTAGIGIFISTVCRNLLQAGLMAIMALIPMVLLSGTWTPVEAMPWLLRRLVTLSPLHHYINAGFGIILKGAGLDALWPSLLQMTLLGACVFAFGLWRFRRQFD